MGVTVGPLFQQMGIWDEYAKLGKHYNEMHMLKEDLTHVHTMHTRWVYEL